MLTNHTTTLTRPHSLFAFALVGIVALTLAFVPRTVMAQETETAEAEDSGPDLQAILQAQSMEDFDEQLKKLKEEGIEPQLEAELELLGAFRSGKPERIREALPNAPPEIDAEKSVLFNDRDEYTGFVKLLELTLALDEGNEEKAKELIGESIWLATRNAQPILQMVDAYKLKKQMADLELPMETEIKTSQGETVTLASLAEGKKALLIDFWASWCGPCIQAMPELGKRAEELEPENVVVVGMNVDDTAEAADEFRKERGFKFPWLMEPEGSPFSKMLQIDSIPRMVLVKPDGKVLFNAHPNDTTSLNEALSELEVSVEL